MAVSIILRTVGGVDDKRAAVSNAAFARTISIGSSWNVIRVGVRLSMTDSGAGLTGAPLVALGMGHGTTTIIGDTSVDNFIGLRTIANSWSRSAGPPVLYSSVGSWLMATKKVAATWTDGAAAADGFQFSGSPTVQRSMLSVDIIKGSPNYTIKSFYRTVTSPATNDISLFDFLTNMEAATPAYTGYLYNNHGNLAASEAAGDFDTVQFHWNRSDTVMEVSDLAVCKFS